AIAPPLDQNQPLASQVEQQRLTHQAVDLYTQLRTKEEVRAIYKNGARTRRMSGRTILAVAASIALLLVAGFLWQKNSYSNTALAEQYSTPYPDRLTTMSDNAEAQLAEAMTAYNSGNYASAIPLFEALPDSLSRNGLAQLYLGISQLKQGQAADAQTSLEAIPSASAYQEAANWYLALSELAQGQEAAARERLETIVAAEAYPGQAAQDLLNQLNSW
ncbi:MAG: tetratricopeptide repeat protein, partial [Bacteroidota bacterium]